MKNARSNTTIAVLAVLALAAAPSARADVRFHVSLPLPPSPREVLRSLPVPPLPHVVVNDRGRGHDDRYADHGRRDGRWNYENRLRDDRYGYDRRHRDAARWAFVEGRWVVRPFRSAVWVDGHYDRWGRWISGYWVRARYR